jgi:hypothetical protein
MFVVAYFVGVFCVLGSQVVLAAAFMGIGLLTRRAFGLTSLTLNDCFAAFWIGFSAIILGLTLWHFVLPINGALLALVLAGGAFGLYASRHAVRGLLGGERWRSQRAWTLAFLIAALYVANQGVGSLTYADTTLYHLQAVAWNESYRLVPGLANLYGPLGFNNSSLLYGALLDVGPWEGLGHRLANGLLLQVLLLRVLIGLARIATAGGRIDGREVFAATFLPGVLALTHLGRMSSYATATTTTFLVLVVAEQLYALLASTEHNTAPAAYTLFSVVTLSAVAVTLKVSAVLFAAPATLLAAGVWLYRRAAPPPLFRRTLAWTLGAALLIGGSWVARGVVLSGYPLFPSRALAMPVDWRAPLEHADAEYALAEHSSKASTMLYEVIAGRDRWGWLPRWFSISRRDPLDFIVPFAIAVAAVLLTWRKRSSSSDEYSALRAPPLMWIPVLIALVAWFFVAPEVRYATGFFWALAALAVAELVRLRVWSLSQRARHRVVLGAGTAAAATLIVLPLLHTPLDSAVGVAKVLVKDNLRIWDSRGWYTQIEEPPLTPFRTASGLVVNVPRVNCWNAPVPCTPNPSLTLEARDPNNIVAGFRVRGKWAMQNWPFRSRPNFLSAWRESQAHERLQPNERSGHDTSG